MVPDNAHSTRIQYFGILRRRQRDPFPINVWRVKFLLCGSKAKSFSPMCELGLRGALLSLVLLCSFSAGDAAGATLPGEVPINPEAGRGGWLIIPVRFESGEELPFVVDTGTSGTFVDKSLEAKLGKPVGKAVFQSWGVHRTNNQYAAPKLYIGGVRLMTPRTVASTDDFKQMSSSAGRPILGMLGYDLLRRYCIQLDFSAGKMRFLDDEQANKENWGKPFAIVPLNSEDGRPAIAENLFGAHGPHSLIDSGYLSDGWLMPKYFEPWTNRGTPSVAGKARAPHALFAGEKYPLVSLGREDVESDGIGIRFLARHCVTLDFPNGMVYLRRQSSGPLPAPWLSPILAEALEPVISAVLEEDGEAARTALARLERSSATDLEKSVARKLAATLGKEQKPAPCEIPLEVKQLRLGDARADSAEVGWLEPAANRIPLNPEMPSPLLDSGELYATGLYAHAPSRYVYKLGGKWKRLRGEAGLHTAFQGRAYGVIFAIKADGKEVFLSPIIRGREHAHYDLDTSGVNTMELLVNKAAERNGGNWGLWLEPMLLR